MGDRWGVSPWWTALALSSQGRATGATSSSNSRRVASHAQRHPSKPLRGQTRPDDINPCSSPESRQLTTRGSRPSLFRRNLLEGLRGVSGELLDMNMVFGVPGEKSTLVHDLERADEGRGGFTGLG